MHRSLRDDSEAVASTVATLFVLLIVLLLLQASVIGVVPQKQYEAEHSTSMAAIAAFDLLRSAGSGVVVPNGQFTVTIPVGTPAISPFAVPSEGILELDTQDVASANVSFRYEPSVQHGDVAKTDQDVVLMIDSSGSMQQNDPARMRISGAKEYIARLQYPDRIGVIDFDGVARLTKANVGQAAHHLWWQGHDGVPDYGEPQTDVDTIDQSGSTNFGAAIQVANDELIGNGLPGRAWIEILLTDGQNNFAWQDTLAVNQAQRAKAYNITIYTIGLGSGADAVLLTQIAQITGGTYYAAPNANSIRWIYFEISMRYQGSFSCGTITTGNTISGSLKLSLGNRRYPVQTLRLEAGGVTVGQPDGSLVQQGLPLTFEPSGLGTGTLRLTALTFTAPGFRTSGTDYRFITAQFVQHSVEDLLIDRPDLGGMSASVASTSAYVAYWAGQGAATSAAANAVRGPLNNASKTLLWGQANMTAGKPTLAKFNVDSAQAQLSATISQADAQVASGAMQNWLGRATKDQVLQLGCRLDQWKNWYTGITMTIRSPNAAAWAVWFNETFAKSGVPISYAVAGNVAILSINAVDHFVLDERVIRLSFG